MKDFFLNFLNLFRGADDISDEIRTTSIAGILPDDEEYCSLCNEEMRLDGRLWHCKTHGVRGLIPRSEWDSSTIDLSAPISGLDTVTYYKGRRINRNICEWCGREDTVVNKCCTRCGGPE